MRNKSNLRVFLPALILATTVWSGALCCYGQDEDEKPRRDNTAATVAKQLSSRDPLVRRRAAEDLARLAAADQFNLVEGYRLEEKNKGVRLALDWAVYRMGKSEALFSIVQALDGSHSSQAMTYISQLETPQPLYLFVNRVTGKAQRQLIKALGNAGDEKTLEYIRPFETSTDPQLAEVARSADREITLRFESPPPAGVTRQRRTGQKDQEQDKDVD